MAEAEEDLTAKCHHPVGLVALVTNFICLLRVI